MGYLSPSLRAPGSNPWGRKRRDWIGSWQGLLAMTNRKQMSFVERHDLWSAEQREAASRLRRIVDEKNLEVIRLSFPDQHGILRGKTLGASDAMASLESGCSITTTMLAKDTSHRTWFPVFTSGVGFGMKEM